jgi:hypothetical protein
MLLPLGLKAMMAASQARFENLTLTPNSIFNVSLKVDPESTPQDPASPPDEHSNRRDNDCGVD